MKPKVAHFAFFVILLFCSSLVMGATLPTEALAAGGTFPAEPFNGLQVNYSVSGARLTSPIDSYSFTNGRDYRGVLTESTLKISGSVSATSGWGASLSVTVLVGKETKNFKAESFPPNGLDPAGGWKQNFDVSVTVDKFSEVSTASFSINLNGSYNAGGRSVVVSGTLRGPLVDLCEEAKLYFTDEQLSHANVSSNTAFKSFKMKMDYNELRYDMQGGWNKYNSEYEKMGLPKPYIPYNVAGAIPAVTWLFAEGGVSDSISKQYVFNKDGIDPLMRGYAVKHGTEPALKEAMLLKATREERQLTPGDVFYLAMIQSDGNVRNAMLLAHNTLRSLARAGDAAYTGVSQDPAFFNGKAGSEAIPPYLVTIREGDNAGPWYHLFGTSFFELESQGQWGPLASIKDMITWENAKGLVSGNLYTPAKDDVQSASSELANLAEQFYRQALGNRNPDIEKFCFNVWGGRLGAWLWNIAPKSGVDISGAKGVADWVKGYTWDPAVDLASYVKNYVTGGTTAAKAQPTTSVFGAKKSTPKPKLSMTGSPINMTWEGQNLKMAIDQSTGTLYGYMPFSIWPIQEKDGTWAMLWSAPPELNYKVALEGTASGNVHLVSIDPETSQIATYTSPVSTGEKLSMDVNAKNSLPSLTRANGEVVKPAIRTADLSPISAGEQTTATDSGIPGWVVPVLIGVIAVAILLIVVTLALLLGRKRTKATRQ
ncbi:hypothetical protein [Candidatus Chlorohelix sp.]|uniref:hypothetical protein n=1 Tax=Candidatus Chlorohelix sp. TaxID=3139201 RepID=UPI003024B50F